ncbi:MULTISPECIES: hypothetical protein [Komagataeibacter]|uniref:Uncharacterized protein n=3 Tax=Komagataeibacter TaxID=1434011 RepID=A0A318QWF0_9PROT|nr:MULTISPECIES: hypothetical protein [Komagataeibacter]MBL7232032.1 hypothetical protein [Komagataeibacter oboediens]MBT0675336.1 hypothetical protein [Komagataeibacter oboediens]MBT0678971.1 hypothetical protein [Komagataeibacter oboediens]MBV0887555.1 hypothetical protein [Komagataeibacter oboediens]MCK9820927.1 hypothetical protein [Komagataeibacter oboediens]
MKKTGRIAAGLLILAGLAVAAPQAQAHGRGGGDAFVGGLVGGLVGGAVAGAMVDAYGPPPPPPPPMYYRPAPPMAYYAPPPPPPPVVVYGPYGGPGRPYY